MKENEKQTIDSKYIQQHLANERTYLAWVRTSITIIGVGFLITNLHFSNTSLHLAFGDLLAQIIGVASILVGMMILVMSTVSYFKKGNNINNQTFTYSKPLILFVSIILLVIITFFGIYYLIAWRII